MSVDGSSESESSLIIDGDKISDGKLTVRVAEKSNEIHVSVDNNGKQESATYVAKVNDDGGVKFNRSEQKFNQDLGLKPVVEARAKAYPALKKAIDKHGGLCDIMCNHIVMGDLLADEKMKDNPYKQANFNVQKKDRSDLAAVAAKELKPVEESLLNKLENDVAPLHLLKQVTMFQIFKAALFDKIPHNHLGSSQQSNLSEATKNLMGKTEKKDEVKKLTDDIIKGYHSLAEKTRNYEYDNKNLEDLKKQLLTVPEENRKELEGLIERRGVALDNDKAVIDTIRNQLNNDKTSFDNANKDMNKLLSAAIDNVAEGKYAKFMSFERSGTEFSGHSMLIKNNGNGSYSFFDPDSGSKRNISKDELVATMTKAFIECGNNNMCLMNVEKMLPRTELKQKDKNQSEEKQQHSFLSAFNSRLSHERGFLSSITKSKEEKNDEHSNRTPKGRAR